MKKILFLLLSVLFVVACNNKSNEAQTKKLLQGAWYTTTLEVNGYMISAKEHPEALSSFVFKDDNVKLLQMGNMSDNVGAYRISHDTIYISDIVNNTNVMTIKIDTVSDKNLDITILGQDVKMKLERMEDKDN